MKILTIICCLGLAGCIYSLIKIENDFKQEMKIIHAIYDYGIATDENPFEISRMYDSMNKLKWYDWGYENIVTREIYNKIKPYL